jgi:hypothetical protein
LFLFFIEPVSVSNLYLTKPSVHLDSTSRSKSTQLDYALLERQLRNGIKDVQTMPVADTNSDHKLLIVKISTRLKKIMKFKQEN